MVKARLIKTERTDREIDALKRFLDELTRPDGSTVQEIGAAVRSEFSRNFTEERSALGGWAQLRPRTQRDRRSLGVPAKHPILDRGGSYKNSFISSDAWRDSSFDSTGWHMEFGSSHRLVGFHENDIDPRRLTSDGRVYMPLRPVMKLDDPAEDRIARALDRIFETRTVPNA